MSKSAQAVRWEVAPEIREAAKTSLPLRLPRPEETGAHRISRRDAEQSATLSPKSRRNSQHNLSNEVVAMPERRRVQRNLDQRTMRQPTDAEFSALAQQALLRSGVGGFARLGVEVRDRVATVSGVLPTDFERQLAVQLVRRVNGLDRVEQEIEVRDARTDEASAATARSGRRGLTAIARTAAAILAAGGYSLLAGWLG